MLAERIRYLEYAIRDIAIIAEELKKRGKKIHYLNIGDPLIFDFKTPRYILDALSKAIYSGYNYYVDSLGILELRKEICRDQEKKYGLKLTQEDILITSGVTEGIFFVFSTLIENRNEILIPGPSYPVYINYAKFFGGIPVEYKLNENNNWNPDINDLRKKISRKTKAILISSPNNPTGSLFSEKKIKEIIDIAGEHNLLVISDEIYDEIVFEKKFSCPAIHADDVPIIGLNGFSKAHLTTGWRLGYIYFHDQENQLEQLKEGVQKMARARLCANSVAQYAALEALRNPGDHTKKMVTKLKERRNYSFKRIKQIEGIDCVNADGAFYLFPKIDLKGFSKWKDDKDFSISLLKETGICTVFGSGFGTLGKEHFRLTFLPTLHELEEIFDLLENYLKK
ncbi:MAG: aminotransferase class I/II-fold pyridoxal phosphate-dependent enzyme [Promethearchaeota archaeon]